MHRKLIVLCDGTWSSPESVASGAAPTNVSRLYRAIEDAGEPTQRALYLRGIGRGRLPWLSPILGGAAGWGLSGQIRRAYTFLVDEFRSGDEIYVFGFSRGAFAVRSLVGLLAHAGLLRRDSAGMVRQLTHAYHHLALRGRYHALIDVARPRMHSDMRVRFLGVWDTVAALGAPVWGGTFTSTRCSCGRDITTSTPRTSSMTCFISCRIDEKRATYAPVLFDVDAARPAHRIEQAWFRGVHSDVGGGYLHSGLADVSLRRMAQRATEAGLRLGRLPVSASGYVLHDSLGPYRTAGVWPRWFPIADSPDHADYDPSLGFLDASVDDVRCDVDARVPGRGWLTDLPPGAASAPVEVAASDYWTNTRVVLREGGEYRVRAAGAWVVRGTPCGADGRDAAPGRSQLRKASGRLGELISLVNAPPTEHLLCPRQAPGCV